MPDEAKAKVPSEILEILTKAENDLEQAKKDAAEVPESDGFFLPKDFVESFDIPF